MNAVPPIDGARTLSARRCARHPDREAAARCPSCGGFFCRECVVEHEGRLLCTACLAKQAALSKERRGAWARVRRPLGLAAATLAAILIFYGMGSILLNVPPEFHEGTIWSPKVGKSP
jgi:hypothetical protein